MRPSRSNAALAVLALAGCPGPKAPARASACPADRSLSLAGQDDVERAAACTTASGLTIRTGAPIELRPLRNLEAITGDLVVGPTVGLDELSLPELREVGGSIQIQSNNSLRGLFLPRLERAGRISIEANASLTTISMPRLESVGGSLIITEHGSLELIDLSVLTRIGKDLVITANPKLALIEAMKLTSVLEVRIDGNRSLPAEQVDALRSKTPTE